MLRFNFLLKIIEKGNTPKNRIGACENQLSFIRTQECSRAVSRDSFRGDDHVKARGVLPNLPKPHFPTSLSTLYVHFCQVIWTKPLPHAKHGCKHRACGDAGRGEPPPLAADTPGRDEKTERSRDLCCQGDGHAMGCRAGAAHSLTDELTEASRRTARWKAVAEMGSFGLSKFLCSKGLLKR